ncbi:hypothetical protein M0812_08258 [Anaeramoeba flamelloides]|uniref:RGS domain-containing protein n=1 Tax=Anaeramoeba flamelloides TaxID=1746091 RepID=A0AAV7ZZ04_9EUKA|nr:hypothetical protein M0812_08258 [Anaeramoeba flamelloides]
MSNLLKEYNNNGQGDDEDDYNNFKKNKTLNSKHSLIILKSFQKFEKIVNTNKIKKSKKSLKRDNLDDILNNNKQQEEVEDEVEVEVEVEYGLEEVGIGKKDKTKTGNESISEIDNIFDDNFVSMLGIERINDENENVNNYPTNSINDKHNDKDKQLIKSSSDSSFDEIELISSNVNTLDEFEKELNINSKKMQSKYLISAISLSGTKFNEILNNQSLSSKKDRKSSRLKSESVELKSRVTHYPSIKRVLSDSNLQKNFLKYILLHFDEQIELAFDCYQSILSYNDAISNNEDTKILCDLIKKKYFESNSLEKINFSEITEIEIELDYKEDISLHPIKNLFTNSLQELLEILEKPYQSFCTTFLDK